MRQLSRALAASDSSRALMYAYMRVDTSEPDDAVRETEISLRCFAAFRRCRLGAIFQEHDTGSLRAFAELTAELARTGARDVVIPSCDHLSAHRLLRDTMLDVLQRHGARIWVLR